MSVVEFINPHWAGAEKVHDWRNYASEQLKNIWSTFSDEQKRVVAETLQETADKEIWD